MTFFSKPICGCPEENGLACELWMEAEEAGRQYELAHARFVEKRRRYQEHLDRIAREAA